MPRQASANQPVVVLTRPETQATEFRANLRGLRAQILLSPVLDIVPSGHELSVRDDELIILTSRNGVLFADERIGLKGRMGFVVGEQTCKLAETRGFKVLVNANTSEQLYSGIVTSERSAPVIHLRGAHTTGNLTGRLRQEGWAARDQVIYEQRARPLSKAVWTALNDKNPMVFPLFSPRSAEIISQDICRRSHTAPIHLVSMSSDIDAAWKRPVAASRCQADTPSAASMADAIRHVVRELT